MSVTYSVQAPEKRTRLTVFFRLLLAIPHFVMLIVMELFALVSVVCAWFALMFTGRYPAGLYSFVASVSQYAARVNAYTYLQVDKYPPFSLGDDESYPVHLGIPPAKESYNRVKVFFRVIVGLPVLIMLYAFGIVAEIMAIVVWLVAIVIGRTPEGLHSALNLGLSYQARGGPYLALLTEDWPDITQESGLTVGDGGAATLPSAPVAESVAPPIPPPAEPAEPPPAFEPPAPPSSPPPPPPGDDDAPGPFGPSG